MLFSSMEGNLEEAASTGGQNVEGSGGSSSNSGAREALVQRLKELDGKRTELEKEAVRLKEYLTAPGMPGLKGGLDDAEGYPRADIDIHGILIARNRLACLNTDYNDLMKEIESGLKQLHGLT